MSMYKSKYYANLNELNLYGIDDFIAHLREGCLQRNPAIHFFVPAKHPYIFLSEYPVNATNPLI